MDERNERTVANRGQGCLCVRVSRWLRFQAIHNDLLLVAPEPFMYLSTLWSFYPGHISPVGLGECHIKNFSEVQACCVLCRPPSLLDSKLLGPDLVLTSLCPSRCLQTLTSLKFAPVAPVGMEVRLVCNSLGSFC